MALNQEKEDIHVLMVALSTQGHINPMLRLGKRLVSKGLHVTLASFEIARHRMFKAAATTSTTTTTTTNNISISGIDLEFFSDGFSLDYDRKGNFDHYIESVGKVGPTNLAKLIHDLSHGGRPKFTCIINNPFVPWVADVAVELGIPCAMLWIQPCTLYSIYYRFYNKLNTFPSSTNPHMSVELPGLPLLQTEDLPSFVLASNSFGSIPKLFDEMFENMNKLKWVLGNSIYEIEKNVIDSMAEIFPIRSIGPLVPSSLLGEADQESDTGVDMWKPDDTCLEWLDHRPPSTVVYISFGSIVVLSAKQMENIATALKNSKRPFLWVVKLSEYPNDGEGKFPLGFLEETKDQGLVVAWCPQTKVLAHPSIACFLSHCGWNSTLETVVAGVPMIACPQWTDQPTNAKLVVDVFQIGLRLRPDENGVVSSEEVERSVEEITAGPRAEEFKKKAAELKKIAREAVADGGSSDRNIQLFVEEVKCFQNRCNMI